MGVACCRWSRLLAKDANRAEKTSRNERRFRFIRISRSERDFVSIRLRVADEPIDPEVHYPHFNKIVAGLYGGADVEPKRCLPYSPNRLSVDRYLGQISNVSEIDHGDCSRLKPISRCVDMFRIGSVT